jgi:ABC-type branched-subunit amino acid transport system ATPase component
LGANGAGKSSTLLALSGLLRASSGSIIFDGVELINLPPHRIHACGLVQVPEGRKILTTLTVRENLLLGDEPSMGLAPLLVQEIFKTLRDLNKQGLTIFLVEQNVREAVRVAHYAYVMENGEIALSGPSAELINNPKVVEAYLGA